MAATYADRADFVTVYIKEAHPTDGKQVEVNETEGICYPQPRTIEDRLAIVRDFQARFHYAIPLLVDPIDNRAEREFGAWPERLYIFDADGRIAYQGAPGPKGFAPDEVEAWLVANTVTTPSADAARLVALAESAHHCAGEEPYDAERGAYLANCIETALAEARPLLARLEPGALPPATLAAVRLFVQDPLTSEERKAACDLVPVEDFLPGLLDDEARAGCGLR